MGDELNSAPWQIFAHFPSARNVLRILMPRRKRIKTSTHIYTVENKNGSAHTNAVENKNAVKNKNKNVIHILILWRIKTLYTY